ncbi:hypothetical protein CEXT_180591 [Caerostris extrusa]|uniref:Uncharacterized protein n=1 Tax=Caerostris extrusa TaxID=172846 RepID=A0AAV4XHT2_CAEEX|nr:hypothetical protein CEXT_180591 [Caerostris extrusa]
MQHRYIIWCTCTLSPNIRSQRNAKFFKNDPTRLFACCRAAVLRPGGRRRLPVGRSSQQHGAARLHEDPGEGGVGGRLRYVHHHELLPEVEGPHLQRFNGSAGKAPYMKLTLRFEKWMKDFDVRTKKMNDICIK